MDTRTNIERRRNHRLTFNGELVILCHADGQEWVCRARCADVSATGVRLVARHKLPSRATVMFNDAKLGITGRGTVRFCAPKKENYHIGIEYTPGSGWRTVFDRLKSAAGSE
ncbi:MAG: PilZ domain-containing protein [Bryobacteraceae bacterium]